MIVVKLNALDVSQYVRVAKEHGLDPADSAFSEPQFAGSPAFQEGQAFVGDAVGNRVLKIPLILSAPSTAELHALIREIEAELGRGSRVEYQTEESSGEPTFFDLERGRLDIDYEYWIARSGYVRGMLSLWTQPYGHTGTIRTVASFSKPNGLTGGPQLFAATGIVGDVEAEANLAVGGFSAAQSLVAYGVRYPAATRYQPVISAASMNSTNPPLILGNSRAIASQAHGLRGPAETYVQFAIPSPTRDWAGRHRVLVVYRHRIDQGNLAVALQHVTWEDKVTKSIQVASQYHSSEFAVLDAGEIDIHPDFDSQSIRISATKLSGTQVASPYFVCGGMVLIPLDHCAGIAFYPDSLDGEMSLDIRSTPRPGLRRERDGVGFIADEPQRLRGHFPRLPPVGSPGPSGPAKIVTMHGKLDDFNVGAGGAISIQLAVRERFRFLR